MRSPSWRSILYAITFVLFALAIVLWILTLVGWLITEPGFEPLNVLAGAVVSSLGGFLALLKARTVPDTPITTYTSTPGRRQRNRRAMSELEQETTHLQELQAKHRKNIRRLEEQLAGYGMKRPLDLVNELDFEREQLRKVKERLEELAGPSAGTPPSEKRVQTAKTEPPTHVVAPWPWDGDYLTITEAIEAANPGDRILVRPSLYEEALVMDKPLEIIGEGNPGDVVVQAKGKSALLFQTTRGLVANLTLRQMSGGEWHCVDIVKGRLELEGCDITSQSRACVAIHGGADPRLRHNRIHNGKFSGVYVYDNGQGTLEDNDIFGNAQSGVKICGGSNLTLHRNYIHENKEGVYIYENGHGVLEENDIFENAVGVEITRGGNPTLRCNRIHGSKQKGVYVRENGLGMLEENDIFDNADAGVTITTGSSLTLRHNRINRNGYVAVQVYNNSAATIEDNDLRDNRQGACYISPDSESNVRRARNLE